ncbi:MAG: DUF1775 domain-containing protein, partial [Nocardioidaceae bacterium]
NESGSEDTVGIDVQLPQGFVLEDAEQVPGWRTAIDEPSQQGPQFVHWSGGSLAAGSFASFAVRGRTPSRSGQISFPITQRLERTTVSWAGPPGSEHPAPIVGIGAAPAGGDRTSPGDGNPDASGSDLPSVPLATGPSAATDAAEGVDDLARSRSSLALSLAAAGLIAGLAGLVIGMGRRRQPLDDPSADESTTVSTGSTRRAATKVANKRGKRS